MPDRHVGNEIHPCGVGEIAFGGEIAPRAVKSASTAGGWISFHRTRKRSISPEGEARRFHLLPSGKRFHSFDVWHTNVLLAVICDEKTGWNKDQTILTSVGFYLLSFRAPCICGVLLRLLLRLFNYHSAFTLNAPAGTPVEEQSERFFGNVSFICVKYATALIFEDAVMTTVFLPVIVID